MALLLQNDTLKRTKYTSNFKGEENFKMVKRQRKEKRKVVRQMICMMI
jgi:hypothetical protein